MGTKKEGWGGFWALGFACLLLHPELPQVVSKLKVRT